MSKKSHSENLSEKDISDCHDAIKVYTKVNKDEAVLYPNTGKLKMDSIIVELNTKNDGRQYKIFHYFEWIKPNKFYGTQCLFSEPPSNIKDYKISNLDGKLYYNDNNNDKVYQTAFYSIENVNADEYDQYNMYDISYQNIIAADFSLPLHANKARGYLTYHLTFKDQKADNFAVQGIYLFQKTFMQYPKLTAKDTYLRGLLSNIFDDLFVTVKTDIK